MDDHTMSFSTLKLSLLFVYKSDLEGVLISLMACFIDPWESLILVKDKREIKINAHIQDAEVMPCFPRVSFSKPCALLLFSPTSSLRTQLRHKKAWVWNHWSRLQTFEAILRLPISYFVSNRWLILQKFQHGGKQRMVGTWKRSRFLSF